MTIHIIYTEAFAHKYIYLYNWWPIHRQYIPWCSLMSMSLCATLAACRAPSTTARGLPTKVYTVLLVLSPGSTSRSEQPSIDRMAEAIASITSDLRPSEKFGTHSTIFSGEELKEPGGSDVDIVTLRRG